MQRKQNEWKWQWNNVHDHSKWLFEQWILPNTLEDFRGKDVLDCGCGDGQHISFVAPYAKTVVGVDLNSTDSAKRNTAHLRNVEVIEADLAQMDLGRTFDVVYCIGVLHHTDDPKITFDNLVKHCKPGGRVILWVYSREGNFLNYTMVEGLKKICVRFLPRSIVLAITHLLTLLLYIPVYTVYLLPIPFFPYYEYFGNWRKLPYSRNMLNVFDKLNAPQTHFIRREQLEEWFHPALFERISIAPYVNVSHRASGTKK